MKGFERHIKFSKYNLGKRLLDLYQIEQAKFNALKEIQTNTWEHIKAFESYEALLQSEINSIWGKSEKPSRIKIEEYVVSPFQINCFEPIERKRIRSLLAIEAEFHINSLENFASLTDHFTGKEHFGLQSINEELRRLNAEFRKSGSPSVLSKIKSLVIHLHQFANRGLKKTNRELTYLKRLIFSGVKVDLRRHLRSIVSFLYKYMSDFSGSEEEVAAIFLESSKPILSINLKKTCLVRSNYCKL